MAKRPNKRSSRSTYHTPLLIGMAGLCLLVFGFIGLRPRIESSHKPCGQISAATPGLQDALDAGLRKLAQYETICNGKPEARGALFVATPATVEQARAYAVESAVTLKAYARYGIAPLVFMEPASDTGQSLDLNAYAAGSYDAALQAYFAALKGNGIVDATMGLWTLLPEGNIPEWTSVDPAIYGSVVTHTAEALKQVFPGTKTAILLDSRTYVTTAYQHPTYASWQPYVSRLPKGLIDSVGLQAYPDAATTSPAMYLRTDFLTEAARTLGVKDVWLSTGTYASLKNPDTGQIAHMSTEQREQILAQIVDRMNAVKAQGFQTSVMLFAENKSAAAEQIDWSYWPAEKPSGSGVGIVQRFIQKLQAAGLQFWVYDSFDS